MPLQRTQADKIRLDTGRLQADRQFALLMQRKQDIRFRSLKEKIYRRLLIAGLDR